MKRNNFKTSYNKKCALCERKFKSVRIDKKFCSDSCRASHSRSMKQFTKKEIQNAPIEIVSQENLPPTDIGHILPQRQTPNLSELTIPVATVHQKMIYHRKHIETATKHWQRYKNNPVAWIATPENMTALRRIFAPTTEDIEILQRLI